MPEAAHAEQFRAGDVRAKILVVDDDPIVRELACAQLAMCGYDTTSAADGHNAWDILNCQVFDLVVCDLDMPILNGFVLIERIRSSVVHRFMPIMVVTTLHDTASIERAFASGATTFVTKPISWPLLGHQVRYLLRSAALEGELRDARDRAEHLVAQKDSFLSVVSHELRTPLNAIIGFAELLSTQIVGAGSVPAHQNYVEEILNGGRRLLGLLQNAFLYSQLLSGELTLNEGEYPLSTLASEARSAVAGRAETEGVTLAMSGFGNAVILHCDLRLLGCALAALADNAVKFSPPDGAVRIEAVVAVDGRLIVAVRDDGPGIPPDEVGRDLAAFTQGDMSLRRSAEGLGLGLTLAHALVRLHGGELAFDRAAQGGTIVRIVLPRSRLLRGAGSNPVESLKH